MSDVLEKMEKARGALIEARNGVLDELIAYSGSAIAGKARDLTSILQALDDIEKAIAEERTGGSGGNVYLRRGLAGHD